MDKMAQQLDRVTVWWPVLFRAFLYFFISFLPAFTDTVGEALKKDEWPSLPNVLLGFLLGAVSGGVALRAFLDNFAHSHGLAIERKRNGGTTPPFAV